MATKGFDPCCKDLPDYLLGITKEIWRDWGVATLHHHCGHDMIKRGLRGTVVGAQAVIDETNQSIHGVPDVQRLGEDVIWSGNEDDVSLSSRCMLEVFSALDAEGRPAGRRLMERGIADCFCINGQITDVGLVYNQRPASRQRGMLPREAAAAIVAEGGPENAVRSFTDRDDLPGPYIGKCNDDEWEGRYEDMPAYVMAADFIALSGVYDWAVHPQLPGEREEHGVTRSGRFWIGLRAAFPSAELIIKRRIGRDDPLMPPRNAMRWSLANRHEGHGMLGPPTGAEVFRRGASQAEWGPRGILRDYVLLDEVHVWKQIFLHRGRA